MYNANSVKLARPGKIIPLFPEQAQEQTVRRDTLCPTCHMPLADGTINYVSQGYDWEKKKTIVKPCPVCSLDTAQRAAVRREMETINRVFGEARIPFRARNWTFENFPADADQHASAQVQAFVARHLSGDMTSKRAFFLGGATGHGKTSLALSALKEVLTVGRSGLYALTADLMLKLQATFRDDSDYTQDQLISAISTVEWLVLDDLAVESGRDKEVSTHVLKTLYLIIQKRADNGLYTVFTSNLSLLDLEKYWRPAGVQAGQFHEGLRVIERLREFCEGCTVGGRNQRKGE
jgi:DNA replication protein DnaC